jgi:D-beta-D-heptose 7-phosphate kinase/D-beta-D-heptose 1-phosphate adenosyltransferase
MKVWVNGTFDIVHIGHIRLLEYAATFGIVRVGLDTDNRVSERKGKNRPFNTLSDRMDFISSIRFVDSVVSFDSDNELISRIREWGPDILVIGNDYKYHEIIGVEYVPKVEFFNKIDSISTTKILGDDKKK